MKAIIIGGSGFIGSHVADSLTERNFKVTIYDKKHPIFKNKKQKYVKGDILNLKKLEKVIHGQDYVFMFAGLSILPFAEHIAVYLIGPVLTTILAVIFLKEKVSLKHIFLIFLGLFGAIIIANPTNKKPKTCRIEELLFCSCIFYCR